MLQFSQLAQIVSDSTVVLDKDLPVQHLLFDSRKVIVSDSSVFFALKSSRRNGHEFIAALYAKGLRQFVVDKDFNCSGFPMANFLKVNDTILAMQQIAAYHRNQFSYPVIGITGSNGKTIVKEWLSAMLSSKFHIVKSPRSFNSQIGVPLSVWQMSQEHQLGIFEAGISQKGEMERLQKVIKPSICIFTNIGSAHDEGFASQSEKIQEKLILARNAKILIYNSDQTDLHQYVLENNMANTFSWGSNGKDLIVQYIKQIHLRTELKLSFREKDFTLEIPFSDQASIQNVMQVVATMLWLGIEPEYIAEKALSLYPLQMRLELREGVNNCQLIDDAYNNDFAGLTTALDFLDQQKQKSSKTVILSDLFEYGRNPAAMYAEIAQIIQNKGIDKVIGIGNELKSFGYFFGDKASFFGSTDEFLSNTNMDAFHNELILIKGARKFQFEKIVQWLTGKMHGTVLEINLDALSHNLNFYRSILKPQTKIMVMVKAFAYGSGSAEVGSLLQFHKVDYLGVAYADEGIQLRKDGITLPIMVMNPSASAFSKLVQYNLEPEIYSFKLFAELLDSKLVQEKRIPIHLKIDTGMHRLGFEEKDLVELNKLLSKHAKRIEVKSVFTHLAAADDEEFNPFTTQQLDSFEKICVKIEQTLGYLFIRHALNSAGIVRFPDRQMDMVRLGIGLYGVEASGIDQRVLLPVGTLKTTISQIKEVCSGESVGYSRKGKVEINKRIATIAIGYADGYSRRFGNGVGQVLINNTLCPIIGNVCMDMCMVDISGVDAQEGDTAIVFGKKPDILSSAQRIGTIPYEILTGIGERVKRVFYSE
jgi:alanine racemase